MKNIPVVIDSTAFTKEDKEQLTILFENAGRKLLDILGQKLGKTQADQFKIFISTSDSVPAVLQEKTATLSASAAVTVTPDTGYDGLSKVTVPKVTAAIDENIVAGNIKKDVVILGVTGTYEG